MAVWPEEAVTGPTDLRGGHCRVTLLIESRLVLPVAPESRAETVFPLGIADRIVEAIREVA